SAKRKLRALAGGRIYVGHAHREFLSDRFCSSRVFRKYCSAEPKPAIIGQLECFFITGYVVYDSDGAKEFLVIGIGASLNFSHHGGGEVRSVFPEFSAHVKRRTFLHRNL